MALLVLLSLECLHAAMLILVVVGRLKKNTGLLIFVQGFVPSGCGEVEV